MKTEDLINALAEDAAVRELPMRARLAIALAIGGTVSAILFGLGLGVRPDIGAAIQTWRFDFKVVTLLTAVAAALWAAAALARPDVDYRKVFAIALLPPALLAAGVAVELLTVAPDAWLTRAIGRNSRICLLAVPTLAIAPLVGLLIALRAGAPRSPGLAGAAAGVLAGTLAAVLYATHCVDDSPLFVAAWYLPPIAAIVALGALAGRRLLRW